MTRDLASGPATRPKRRWRTLSLRALMILIALVASGLAWETNRARTQRRAVEALWNEGVEIYYDDAIDEDGCFQDAHEYPAWKTWVMRNFGDEYIVKVRYVSFGSTDHQNNTRLSAASWNALADLPDVSYLNLQQCDVDDADLVRLRGCNRLGWLDLSNNTRISDAGLAHLSGLRNLKHLDLSGVRIGDAGMPHLRNLTRLDSLLLAGTRISDIGLASLRDLHNMQVLDLSATQTGDAGLATLGRLTSLKLLAVGQNPISDAGIAHLKDLGELRTLFIDQTRLTDASIPTFERMPALTWLSAKASGMTADGVKALKLARPNLEVDF
ncbi:MAG TPA: hypothetical protein VGZ22_11490 [Isosphaeraceae bacterium]|jgi:hypothetical protein|nr:hypothetical protein [Isosphaeraceae bacterium]